MTMTDAVEKVMSFPAKIHTSNVIVFIQALILTIIAEYLSMGFVGSYRMIQLSYLLCRQMIGDEQVDKSLYHVDVDLNIVMWNLHS